MFEPDAADFPGLAPAIDEDIDPLRLEIALRPVASPDRPSPRGSSSGRAHQARLGRHHQQGWEPAQLSAVLRSWEDRFGARLLEVGFADIRLVVSRPPRTLDEALPIAAEHVAFCSECARMGLRHVRELAQTLVGNPFWDFWWD